MPRELRSAAALKGYSHFVSGLMLASKWCDSLQDCHASFTCIYIYIYTASLTYRALTQCVSKQFLQHERCVCIYAHVYVRMYRKHED